MMSYVSKPMYALFLAFIFGYSSAKIIDIDQDLTELQLTHTAPFTDLSRNAVFFIHFTK